MTSASARPWLSFYLLDDLGMFVFVTESGIMLLGPAVILNTQQSNITVRQVSDLVNENQMFPRHLN